MAAIVGGRIEAVAPRRSLFGPDYLRLAALVVVAVAVHAWLVGHTAVTARDGLGFARYALAIQSPHASVIPWDTTRTAVDVIKSQEHPPGYPAAIWLTAKFVRHLLIKFDTPLPLSESTLLAAQLVSAIAGVLLVVPIYLLGRMLFSRNVGFAAALLFQVLPVPARITSDGLAEGLYLLVSAAALVFGVRAVRRPGVGGFLVCGLTCGAGYLVRPEGLMGAVAVGMVAAWLGLTRKWPRDLTLGRLTALAVGVALVAAPYMLLIGKLTNKPTPQHIIPSVREQVIKDEKAQAPVLARGPVFAVWWQIPPGAGPLGVVRPAVVGILEETGKGLHYGAAVLALLGMIALRRRFAADPGLGVLLALVGINVVILLGLGATGYYVRGKHTGYVSERHTVLIVMVGCLFAAAALQTAVGWVGRGPRVGRLVAAGLLTVLVAVALPATLKPLHAHREGYKHAGLFLQQEHEAWLAENEARPPELREPAAGVYDPFEWSDWYSGRTLYTKQLPANPDLAYAVIDNSAKDRSDAHERLPVLDQALGIRKDGRAKLVYYWPTEGGPERAAVHVYKLDTRKK
jgi:4-amino-4-deoxy-L-arabinose transferase-like glycosyltransferase